MNFYADDSFYQNIIHIIKNYGIPKNIIEIGVYEGLATFWLSDTINEIDKNINAKIYAIDPHAGSEDLKDKDFNVIKNNFLYNLSICKNNVEYIQKYSTEALLYLIQKNVKVDLIYVDGDHRASQVLTDLVLAWELINVGGMILCDDSTDWKYKDANKFASAQLSPRMAIESFIQCNWHKLDIVKLPNSSQTAFVKISQ